MVGVFRTIHCDSLGLIPFAANVFVHTVSRTRHGKVLLPVMDALESAADSSNRHISVSFTECALFGNVCC